jgi:hypothetical protein
MLMPRFGTASPDGSGRAGAHPWARLAAPLAAMLVAAAPVHAQSQGDGFLFRAPIGSFTLRGGLALPGTGGDLFSFIRDTLTVGRSAFNGMTLGADLAFRLAPRFDVAFSADYAGASAGSEFRNLVDQDRKPIAQTTTFRRVPLSASLKAYLRPRGQSIGTLAWMPEKYAPFVGVGGGATWYKLQQKGDFVNYVNNEIFSDDLVSTGWAPTAHGLVGLDVSLSPRFAFTTQGKYTLGKAKVAGQDFQGFDRIDLSGFAATAGFYVRF